MPTNRKRTKRSQDAIRLTAAAVQAFRDRDSFALTQELRLRPWWPSPLDTDDAEPPEWAAGSPYGNAWCSVREIRLALEAAA